MKDLEFLRIMDFLQALRLPWAKIFPKADSDLVRQLLHDLMSSHTKGDVVTTSALAQAGYAPYTTSLRKIEDLIT